MNVSTSDLHLASTESSVAPAAIPDMYTYHRLRRAHAEKMGSRIVEIGETYRAEGPHLEGKVISLARRNEEVWRMCVWPHIQRGSNMAWHDRCTRNLFYRVPNCVTFTWEKGQNSEAISARMYSSEQPLIRFGQTDVNTLCRNSH